MSQSISLLWGKPSSDMAICFTPGNGRYLQHIELFKPYRLTNVHKSVWEITEPSGVCLKTKSVSKACSIPYDPISATFSKWQNYSDGEWMSLLGVSGGETDEPSHEEFHCGGRNSWHLNWDPHRLSLYVWQSFKEQHARTHTHTQRSASTYRAVLFVWHTHAHVRAPVKTDAVPATISWC